ncbi:Gfo/Idh/MocA family oxidoreductase [Microbacterium sp. zg.Y625]|uniref:Gfo/Idh/MocA family protein n=1 Tax=Microbacterium jiangjiandongii TaxID=3049071 RepID=UPI00214BB187|nr:MULTISPECIES: Gfo/Idh/MocA family oxidoreductase [unclassified Microbacterium]MCR2793378.1 Gfo/Idh/MocA family oxidoreductase [Microbacterium sp. zg.Y625]WIM25249.1 Gfo/Idh/MocA family oxidoreductase [Microbacterium sp. zg-Y625]
MGQPRGIGIIGLGVISRQYLETLAGLESVRIVAAADLDADRAAAVAAEVPGCRALTVDELLADPAVDTVINLTIPAAHADIALAALAHGKDVYGEKPLAATLTQAKAMMDAAGDRWVGGAPDTVLGTGIQTARAAVEAGDIGRPVSAVATWVSGGHESWHPHPDFYYRDGGGPLFDMGPYYLTSLVHLLGPVVRVSGASSRTRDTRRIGSGPRAGEIIPVEIDTHVTGVLEHGGGALSTVTFSFDAVGSTAAPIEVHGEEGSLSVPDPNTFAGEVRLRRRGEGEWTTLPDAGGYVDAGRGIGVIDHVRDGEGRASGELALHVLEIMTALIDSAHSGERVALTTTARRPSPVPLTPQEEWRR